MRCTTEISNNGEREWEKETETERQRERQKQRERKREREQKTTEKLRGSVGCVGVGGGWVVVVAWNLVMKQTLNKEGLNGKAITFNLSHILEMNWTAWIILFILLYFSVLSLKLFDLVMIFKHNHITMVGNSNTLTTHLYATLLIMLYYWTHLFGFCFGFGIFSFLLWLDRHLGEQVIKLIKAYLGLLKVLPEQVPGTEYLVI